MTMSDVFKSLEGLVHEIADAGRGALDAVDAIADR
jgi:hypothetical protein